MNDEYVMSENDKTCRECGAPMETYFSTDDDIRVILICRACDHRYEYHGERGCGK